ncbi:MAG: VOC family protein [Zavarzinella sp.]|nr:VOC family protein [Zavarzinella sp.]
MVAAPTLDRGAAWVLDRLGAVCRPGGAHAKMGTHNRLLRLGPSVYLEVIAIDPAAPAPGRPRWFGLDALAPDAEPRLTAWVVRTDDLVAAAAASPVPLGPIEPMARGDLTWRITVPPDGSLPLGGAGPLLIRWESGRHPADRLPDDGYGLVRLEVAHPAPECVAGMLAATRFTGPVTVAAGAEPRLAAVVATPHGNRWL